MDVTTKKDEGNKLFAEGKLADAAEVYAAAIAMYHAGPGCENAPPAPASAGACDAAAPSATVTPAVLATLHSNLAACYLRLDEPTLALKHCDDAIAIDATLTKVCSASRRRAVGCFCFRITAVPAVE